MKRRRRNPVVDRTYRTEPSQINYWAVSQPLLGKLVVVWLPEQQKWKAGYLIGLIPADDIFLVKWRKTGFGRTFKGIWRVHDRTLFTGTKLLPVPKFPARLSQSTNRSEEDHRMATSRKPAAAKKSAAKKSAAKKAAPAEAESNGAKKGVGRARVADKLEGLSEAKRRNIAKLIYRERSKKPATSWPDIQEMVEDKYDWALPGSMTGRRLLREYGPDGAEDAIIKQDRSAPKPKSEAKTKPSKKAAAKKKAVVEEEYEEEEELDEEEELEDEEEMEEEEEYEDEEDEDEEEDEEEEEPEPAPRSRAKKSVVVRKGRSKK